MTSSQIVAAALDYQRRGWWVTPVAGKAPVLEDWPNSHLDEDAIRQSFGSRLNVGVVLGPSGLADLDFDDPIAVKALRALKPPELEGAALFKHAGRPHLIVNAAGVETRRLRRSDGSTLLELRGASAFLRAYSSNLRVQTREAVQGHVVGGAILALMEDREEWTGSPTELLTALEEAGEDAKLFRRAANGKVQAKGWPGAPHILTRRFNEARSNLADLGFEIVADRKAGPVQPAAHLRCRAGSAHPLYPAVRPREPDRRPA